VQRCVGEVLAGESDVKKDERCFPRGCCGKCRGAGVKCLLVKEM